MFQDIKTLTNKILFYFRLTTCCVLALYYKLSHPSITTRESIHFNEITNQFNFGGHWACVFVLLADWKPLWLGWPLRESIRAQVVASSLSLSTRMHKFHFATFWYDWAEWWGFTSYSPLPNECWERIVFIPYKKWQQQQPLYTVLYLKLYWWHTNTSRNIWRKMIIDTNLIKRQ